MKRTLRKHLAPGIGILTGRSRYSWFKEIAGREWLGPDELQRIQNREIIQLLKVARNEVPFYRELLAHTRLDDEERALELLQTLPVLRKTDFQREFARLISVRAKRARTYAMTTGGSTGAPLKLLYDDEANEKKHAAFMRSLSWGGWKPGEPVAMIWGGLQEIDDQKTLASRVKTAMTGIHVIGSYRYDESVIPVWMDRIQRHQIRFLYGYATVLYRIARFYRSSEMRPPEISAVFSTAETLHPEHRGTIEDVFQCRVYNHYGSREVVSVAAECDRGSMHVQTDMVHAEFATDDGADETDAGLPHLVLTSFTNHVMPFIRYDIEDCGFPRPGLCDCGRGFPLMDLRIGRMNDHFLKPNGEYIYPSFLIHLLDDVEGIRSFQFRQEAGDLIRLRCVKDERFGPESQRVLDEVPQIIRRELDWQHVTVDILDVDEIPVSGSGKHRFVVSDVGTIGGKVER